MTGDLISHYEAIASKQGANGTTNTLADGLREFGRRMTRSSPSGGYELELEDALAWVGDWITDDERAEIKRSVERAIPECESPIEKTLLPWLVAQEYPGFRYSPRVLFPGEGGQLEDKCVAVVPQLPMGRYRADFAIAARRGPHLKFLVVECDGAAFHDAVSQVRRDIDRDVSITNSKKVLDVVRFSGAQIYKSPRECAVEVARALVKCWRKDNADLTHKFDAL